MDHIDGLPIYRCPKIDTAIAIDANLNKPPWSTVQTACLVPTTQLLDHPTPFQPTTVAACWSDTHLYFAFRCEDRDIWGSYTQRDDPLYEEEVVEVFLCPTGDIRHYYEFEVSPRNVVFDATVFSPDLHRPTMQVDANWNCPGLLTAVEVNGTLNTTPSTQRPNNPTTQNWSVEIAIPFAAFPEASPPKPGDAWRANFYRIDRANPPEFTAWSPTHEIPANFHVPQKFGWLQFEE